MDHGPWTMAGVVELSKQQQRQHQPSSKFVDIDTPQQQEGATNGMATFISTILWPGLGLLGESYILFSIGTLHPMWSSIILRSTTNYNGSDSDAATATVSDDDMLSSSSSSNNNSASVLSLLSQIPYLVCCSIMSGMILFGTYTNTYGRRYGSIGTATCMLAGCATMTLISIPMITRDFMNSAATEATSHLNHTYWYIFVVGMTLFGFGVGGEYPVAAASATERTMILMQQCNHQQQQIKSGQHIQFIFTMQGVGIVLQVLILTMMLYTLQHYLKYAGIDYMDGENAAYTDHLLQGYIFIWLLLYVIGTIILLIVLITRILHLQESAIWNERRPQSTNNDCYSGPPPATPIADPVRYQQTKTNDNNIATTATLTTAMPKIVVAPTTSYVSTISSLTIPSQCTTINNTNNGSNKFNTSNNNNKFTDINTHERIFNEDCSNIHPQNDPYTTATTITTAVTNRYTKGNDNSLLVTMPQQRHERQLSRKDVVDNLPTERNETARFPNDIARHHWTTILQIVVFHSHYGVRLLSVSFTWFLWDVAFYGNKLFQSKFLFALTKNDGSDNINEYDDKDSSQYGIESMIQLSKAASLNAMIALCGYITAAHIIDHPWIGRRNLQLYGFMMTGLLFLSVGYFYDILSTNVLLLMYFGTSFFGQCGPNATTFILPSEVFPTQLRTVCHGIAAASGKFGALMATVLFHRISNDVDLFLLSGFTSFIAAAATYWFIPETVGCDLRENDRHWEFILASYPSFTEYSHDPKYLSVYEQQQQLMKQNSVNDYQYNKCDDSVVHS